MKEGRLHLRLDPQMLKQMKVYSKRRGTNLTALVTKHFQELLEAEKVEKGTQPLLVEAESA